MKVRILLASLLLMLVTVLPTTAQVTPLVSSQLVSASGAVALSGLNEIGTQSGRHVLTYVITATVSACTVQIETSSDNITYGLMSTSVAKTCTSSGAYEVQGQVANYVRINVTALTVSGGGSVLFALTSYPNTPVVMPINGALQPSAGWTNTSGLPSGNMVYWVPLQACGFQLTTGALAAASTVGQNPGIANAAANNHVLQVITSAAASAATLDCDITPPYSTSTNKSVTISDVAVFYGYQGAAALSSITDGVFKNVTYSAATGAAAGTVSSALGGVLTVNAGTSHTTPAAVTTTGQCYSEDVSFGTPIVVSANLARTTMEYVFNHTTASAATYQLCGVLVRYTINY